jgi:UrcA family protein
MLYFARFTIVAAGVALSLAGARLAHAQTLAQDTQTQRVVISVADLDLHVKAGLATMHRRIRAAARSVCGEESPVGALDYRAFETCVAAAKAGAETQGAILAGLAQTSRFADSTPAR